MRIIAGSLKGRRLDSPGWDGLRPTSDSLRETLFNVLGQVLDGLRVVDGFAGTGALGIEAISRGASHVTFVERDARAVSLIAAHLEKFGVSGAASAVRDQFERWASRESLRGAFDLVLLDPPYEGVDLASVVAAVEPLLAAGGRLVLEHARRRAAPDTSGALARVRVVEAGDSALSFYLLAAGER